MTEPKKKRGLAAMDPAKAAAIRAKGAFTSERAREAGAASRSAGNTMRAAAPALVKALEGLYAAAEDAGIPHKHEAMITASEAIKTARGIKE